jgi:hypothetical protein
MATQTKRRDSPLSYPHLLMEDLRCPPLWGTRRSPERPTLGGAVGRIATALGKPPLPHQQYLYDVALELNPDTGKLAYDSVILVGPRQVTGKTEVALPVMTHRCTGFGPELAEFVRTEFGLDVPEPGPQRVLYTAQTADVARERWRDTHVDRIKKSPLRELWAQSPRLRLNMETMFWINGSTWAPGATTGKTSGTGDTIDLAFIDEMWAKEDDRTELGLRPAMLTRFYRQLWAMSMVPGISRVPPEKWPYMRRKMMTGRNRVEADMRTGTCYMEYSAPLDADPADEDTWWLCMPALGYTVPVENVRTDFAETDLVDFCAEYLGWWPTGNMPTWSVISEDTWNSLAVTVPDYKDPIAVGVDGTNELSAASIGMAAQLEGGDIYLELIDRRAGVGWVIDAVVALCRKHSVCAIGIDRNGPLAGLIRPLTRTLAEHNLDINIAGLSGQGLNSAEVSAACATFYNETGEQDDHAEPGDAPTLRRVHHLPQRELDQAVGGAVRHYHGDRWRWDRANSTSDVAPLYAVNLAEAAGDAEEWIGGAYDIGDSLG